MRTKIMQGIYCALGLNAAVMVAILYVASKPVAIEVCNLPPMSIEDLLRRDQAMREAKKKLADMRSGAYWNK